MEKPYLEHIKYPSDISDFTQKELSELCEEIREKLINVVSRNGGHLASNLGTVELTVALEKVFSSKNDSIVMTHSMQDTAVLQFPQLTA